MNFAVQRSARSVFGLTTLLSIAVLAVLAFFAPPDGNERSEWLQFLGAFHPIAVHLPIAILILVPLLEVAGRTRFFPQLLSSVDFLLGVAMLGAMVAIGLGWSLARSGNYSGSLVTQHMWSGITVAAAAWICWVLRARTNRSGGNRNYIVALVATVGLVSFTGYRGGQLSQGENHLTEHMPAQLRTLLGMEALANAAATPTSDPSTFYGAQIQPIFSRRCIGCHGTSKHKANLRLDSYDRVMRGSKDGVVVKAGNATGSELFRRVTLPPTDDDFMPSGHKPALSSNEIKTLEFWISSGASATQPADAGKNIPGDSGASATAAEVSFEQIDPTAVAKQRSPLASTVRQLQQRFPSALDYESRSSANLIVHASLLGANFSDNELAALRPIYGQVIEADFSNTAISDQSATNIAAMKRLRSLRLAQTKITDATVKGIGTLTELESLSLFGTAVSADAVAAIGQLPKLKHVYLHETKISPDTPMPEQLRNKVTF